MLKGKLNPISVCICIRWCFQTKIIIFLLSKTLTLILNQHTIVAFAIFNFKQRPSGKNTRITHLHSPR